MITVKYMRRKNPLVHSINSYSTLLSLYAGERVVVVCHGGVIIAIHNYIMGKNPSSPVINASINVVRVDELGDWDVLKWGEVGHLDLMTAGTFGGGLDTA